MLADAYVRQTKQLKGNEMKRFMNLLTGIAWLAVMAQCSLGASSTSELWKLVAWATGCMVAGYGAGSYVACAVFGNDKDQ